MTRTRAAAMAKKRAGIVLDISLGGVPQANAVTMRELKHDPRKVGFPLPPHSVTTAVIVHVLEYLDPKQWFRWWDALHFIMRPYGVVYASGPYGGDDSQGWLSDPTHRVRVVEQSFSWLDPQLPHFELHPTVGRRFPQPWHTLAIARVPGSHGTVSYNATMQAVPVARQRRRHK